MISVLQFPGSNCDRDVLNVFENVLEVNSELVWWKEFKPEAYTGVVLPGGFTYGDYLRPGAIAAKTAYLNGLNEFIESGKPVLGICNGFQILVEMGHLPGALMSNVYPKFLCKKVNVKVVNNETPFTEEFKEGEILTISIAHQEGNYRPPENGVDEEQIVFRYCSPKGTFSQKYNPNGSFQYIAGIINEKKQIMGMMPHPERASEKMLGSTDGLKIMRSFAKFAEKGKKL